MKKFITFCLALLLTSPAFAAEYAVDKAASSITFSGTHAGKAFNGTFGDWQAEITFDAAKLNESRITARISTASAKTGDAMYDGTLPTEDWFDVKNHHQARFTSTEIKRNDSGGFTALGNLTLKGITQPVRFDFTLNPADGAAAEVTANAGLTLDRLAYSIGAKSDAKAEWVSRDITLNVALVATKK